MFRVGPYVGHSTDQRPSAINGPAKTISNTTTRTPSPQATAQHPTACDVGRWFASVTACHAVLPCALSRACRMSYRDCTIVRKYAQSIFQCRFLYSPTFRVWLCVASGAQLSQFTIRQNTYADMWPALGVFFFSNTLSDSTSITCTQ